MMSNVDLASPTRQELRGLLVILVVETQKIIRLFWPLFIMIFVQNKLLPENLTVGMLMGLIISLLLIHTLLYYLNFLYYVDKDHFILKKGYLKKKELSIPLERIQSVNTSQNLLQQILNVYSLEIDTAGSAGKELKIHSLNGVYASELTNYLRSHKTEKDITSIKNPDKTKTKKEERILNLSAFDLLKIGISENHIKTGLFLLAFGSQIFGQIEELFEEKAQNYSSSFFDFMADSSWVLLTTTIIFFLFVSILASLVLTVIKYYGFSLYRTNRSYRISSGLLNKRNVIIPFSKVQQLNWETGPVKRLFGISKITFKQAVSMQMRNKQLVDSPGCLQNHILSIRAELFGNKMMDTVDKIYAHPSYFRFKWLKSGIIPVLLSLTLSFHFYNQWVYWAVIILWLAASATYAYVGTKKQYFQFDGTQLIVGKGTIGTQWQQTYGYKTQTIDFKQSIFQKRRKLATLKINNASGQIAIPYIDEEMAKKLMNYLIYHVEISRDKWM